LANVDPGNETDFTASLRCLNWLRKTTRSRGLDWTIDVAIHDAGHDARPFYQWLLDHDTIPMIPLSKDAPAHHPWRLDLALSKRSVPMCQDGVEMTPWGSAGSGRTVFIRLHLIAFSQHARAWVADQDSGELVSSLLGGQEYDAVA